MKKILFTVLLVSLLAIFAMAEPITVEFWHAMGGGHGEAVAEIVDSFNAANPDIVVEPIYIGNYNALLQKLLASAESGNLPNLSQSYSNWTAKLLPRGIVQELDSYMKNKEYGLTDAEYDSIYPPFKKMGIFNGVTYALPFNKSTYVLYYNTDAFEEYGLSYPKTMEDLQFAAMMLTNDSNGDGETDNYGFGLRTTVDHFAVFLRANGGSVLKQNPDNTWEITINSPEAKEALAFMNDMVNELGIAYAEGGYLDGPFGDGKIAMFIETIASKPYVDSASIGKHGWAWAPIPSWETMAPPFAGTDIIMFDKSDEEDLATWKFMKYLLNPEIQAYWSIKSGYMPAVSTALDTPQYKEYIEQNPDVVVPLEELPYGSIDPNIAEWNEIRTILGTMVGDVINGKKSVDEGLAWAEKEIEREFNK